MSKHLDTVVLLADKAHKDFVAAPAESKDYFAGQANALARAASKLRDLDRAAFVGPKRDVLKAYIDDALSLCAGMCLDEPDERRLIVSWAASAALGCFDEALDHFDDLAEKQG